jgi:hypothetical protein
MNMNTVPKMKKIQTHFEDSNLELDLSKNADGHYLNEVARYAWMNWMTAYSLGREHQAAIASNALEISPGEAFVQQAIAQQEQPLISAEEAIAGAVIVRKDRLTIG